MKDLEQMFDSFKHYMYKVSVINATKEYIKKNGLSQDEEENMFVLADHVTKYVEDFCKEHEESYKKFDADAALTKELSEIIQHVGYDDAQCGREK